MPICTFCQTEVPDAARFCGHCGQQLEEETRVKVVDVDNSSKIAVSLPFMLSLSDKNGGDTTLLGNLLPRVDRSPLDLKNLELTRQRLVIVSNLQLLLPFAPQEHFAENKALFERALTTKAALEDTIWGDIAHTIRAYARALAGQPLTSAQKYGMWQAGVWAVRYESCFRPKMVSNSFHSLLRFLKEAFRGVDATNYPLRDIETFMDELNASDLRRLLGALACIADSPALTQFQQKVELLLEHYTPQATPAANAVVSSPEEERVKGAIERLWDLLDKKLESQNREQFELARAELGTPQTLRRLAVLAASIGQEAVYRYAHRHSLSDEQLQDAVVLARFSSLYNSDDYSKASLRHLHLLENIQRMRARSIDPAASANYFKQKFVNHVDDATAVILWTELLAIVTYSLGERRSLGTVTSTETRAWRRVFDHVEGLPPVERELFLTEVKRYQSATSSTSVRPQTTLSAPVADKPSLQTELAAVRSLRGLKTLEPRLKVWLDQVFTERKGSFEHASFFKSLLAVICTLDETEPRRDLLHRKLRNLSATLERAWQLVDQEAELQTLRPLILAWQRVFADFVVTQELAPKPQINPVPLGPGLPDEARETALALRIVNPGPDEILHLHVAFQDTPSLASRDACIVECLPENVETLILVPLKTLPSSVEQFTLDCRLQLTYQWSNVQNLVDEQSLTVSRFSFRNFLAQHGLQAHEIPNPYLVDDAIDVSRHNPRLFRGREGELSLLRTTLIRERKLESPLYFYGVPRVGKTSLLYRLAAELKTDSFVPLVVSVQGLYASSQTLKEIIATFCDRLRQSAAEQGIEVSQLKLPTAANSASAIAELEAFLKSLRSLAGAKRLVLLLDEFQDIVAPSTTPLLDCLRRVHYSDLASLIMAGWKHPEALRQDCLQTLLFPLKPRPLDFLPLETVRQVLRLPVADLGIEVPEATIQHVYEQTAGNPYHVALIAHEGIERLNTQQRTVLVPQDVEVIAGEVAGNALNFTSSVFSSLVLSQDERDVALRFVEVLGGERDRMPLEDATSIADERTLRDLEEKGVLTFYDVPRQVGVKGKLLTSFLRLRLQEPRENAAQCEARRVGIFVDLENIWPHVPSGMTPEAFGRALMRHAASCGTVVCHWVCADLRNIQEATSVSEGLKRAGFSFQSPRGESRRDKPMRNVSDFVLLERVMYEGHHSQPDIYILASGDGGYYDHVLSLIESNHIVRVVASKSRRHLNTKYSELQKVLTGKAHADPDFFIDDLDELLRPDNGKLKR